MKHPTGSEQDLVAVYSSNTVDAEIEADVIRGVLESNGIPAMITGSPVHSLAFEVLVPRERLKEAEACIAEAKEAGSTAASEAEEATEN